MLRVVPKKGGAFTEYGFDDQAEAEILGGLRALRPLLQAEAAAAQELRTPTPKVVAALDKLGVWSASVPKRLGGQGISATGLMRISAELATGDPSVAWVSQIINGTTSVTTLVSDELQEDLFANGVPRFCGVFNPPGTAIPVAGGYRVSGKWPYASAYRQAEWGQWGVTILPPDGAPVRGNFCYIPVSETSLENTWTVPGLQATGSDTAVAQDVFVPEHRMVHAGKSYNYVEPDKKHYGAPSDYFSPIAFVHRTHAGIMLGAAEALFEVVCEAAKIRPVVGSTFARQSDSGAIVRDLGECGAKLMAARILAENATGQMDQIALQRRPMTQAERYGSKAQGCYTMQVLGEVVEKLMTIAGSSAFLDTHPASRYWRDFSFGMRHFAYTPHVGFESYGRAILGIEPNVMIPHLV